jgi:hypothetical protein
MILHGKGHGQLTPEQVREFIEWAKAAQERTGFDVGIIGYPKCFMLYTEEEDKRCAYLPCQTVLMAEVFIPNPESSTRDKVKSLKAFDKAMQDISRQARYGDVYLYVPREEIDYARQLARNGWQEVEDVRLFKKPTGVTV